MVAYDGADLVIEDRTPSEAECTQPAEAYRTKSAEACLDESFLCGAGQAAFAHACGCGCAALVYRDSAAASATVEAGPVVHLPTECQGPSGLLMVFTRHIERMILLVEYAYLLVEHSAPQVDAWHTHGAPHPRASEVGQGTVRLEHGTSVPGEVDDGP